MSIIDAVTHPQIWAPWFAKNPVSWAPWFTVFKTVFGLPLDDGELALFRRCTGRQSAPLEGFNEIWLCCGRRAGKSLALAVIAVFLAVFRDWSSSLAPGERGVVQILASERSQSRVILRYVKVLLKRVPALKGLIERETRQEIDLSNGIVIEITTASMAAVRGYTLVAGLCDEIAFWTTDDGGTNPDVEVLAALRPAMLTVPGAMLLIASSPYAQKGALWQAHRRHFGKEGSPVLFWHAPTKTMHPSVPQAEIDRRMEEDPDSGRAEYFAEFRSSVGALLPRELIEAAVDKGITVRPPRADIGTYACFVDVAGGTGSDAFAAAVCHPADGKILLDAVFERKPPFSPAEVCRELRDWMREYRLTIAIGDAYAAAWVIDQLRELGVEYQHSTRNRSEIYLNALPLFSSGRVSLIQHDRLVNQLVSLERMTGSAGRDRVDAKGHEDIANAVCGSLVLAAQKPQEMVFCEPWIAGPADLPARIFDPETGRSDGYGLDHRTFDMPRYWR